LSIIRTENWKSIFANIRYSRFFSKAAYMMVLLGTIVGKLLSAAYIADIWLPLCFISLQ